MSQSNQLFGTDDTGDDRGGSTLAADPNAPLAVRMRPNTLAELVGQEHLLGEGSALRTAIESGQPHSMILVGPPGSGKTTLARIVAGESNGAFEEHSAVSIGRPEVRAVIDRARERRSANGRATVLFLDEIHRFNKAQQDALLPAVEDGTLTLIGATTENPYFEVNSALISRSQVYELRSLTAEQMTGLLKRAMADPERGLAPAPAIEDDALALIATRAGGDVRAALGALERAVVVARGRGADQSIDLPIAEDSLQRKAVAYDKGGDKHYDYISSWIKATRGSDVDASLYYLAAMLEGGEDPRFIVRRMVILASEDIGNADPQALVVATAAGQAVDRIGLPECSHALAQTAVYLAMAPKSNASYKALGAAREHVRRHGAAAPPPYLQDGHYPGAEELGRGVGYRYAHDEPGAVTDQPLIPDGLEGERFYLPTDRGAEVAIGERLEQLRRKIRGS